MLSLATQNAKLRASPTGWIILESASRKSLDEEKHLTTTFAIQPSGMESRLDHEHGMLFFNSIKMNRQMIMGYYDNKFRKKVNRKAEKERAEILRKEKEVMRKSRRK